MFDCYLATRVNTHTYTQTKMLVRSGHSSLIPSSESDRFMGETVLCYFLLHCIEMKWNEMNVQTIDAIPLSLTRFRMDKLGQLWIKSNRMNATLVSQNEWTMQMSVILCACMWSIHVGQRSERRATISIISIIIINNNNDSIITIITRSTCRTDGLLVMVLMCTTIKWLLTSHGLRVSTVSVCVCVCGTTHVLCLLIIQFNSALLITNTTTTTTNERINDDRVTDSLNVNEWMNEWSWPRIESENESENHTIMDGIIITMASKGPTTMVVLDADRQAVMHQLL